MFIYMFILSKPGRVGLIYTPFYFQGYGLTESTSGQFLQEDSDLKTHSVGRPMAGAEARLVNWEEGGYTVTDKPNPRGEVILGGDSIAKVKYQRYYMQ